jgi:TIR domain
MAGGDGGRDPDVGRQWQWDVVLSFAGGQRDYVAQVAAALKARGVRCFYDADEQPGLWGKHLAEELPAIYGEQAGAVVVFISAEYAARDWTRLERRAALDRAARERREYVLPARFDDTPLPGLLTGIVTTDLRGRAPQEFAAMIAAKLAGLGITGPAAAQAVRPPGAVRVAEADLRRLGVHAAISVPGIPDEVPPEYVPRDADAAEFGVRAKLAAATKRGGFVLLTGGSSAGKTRCAAEAVRELLPDWWLVHPAGPGEVAALAAAPPARTVVWLDELQRYLDGEHGLTGGMVRALLSAPGPVVLIGTLWPDRYDVYAAVPVPGETDLHAREREELDLAAVISIGEEFSAAEQDRARAAAVRDPRVRVALETAGYGLTQTLAAAPQLVARWEAARAAAPHAWAVLTAALDAARLGARAPLSAGFLLGAAPGYCTPRQQAEAPDGWFEQALAYATRKLHGAAAALAPSGTGMGQVDGYIVADYLLQQATGQRRTDRVPASTWDALLLNISDPADAARLADSARNRLLYRYAIPLYHHAADAGDGSAAWRLAGLLRERGDLDGAAPAPTPATGTPPGGWPGCSGSAGTWTGPCTSCAPAPTPTTGTPPGSWPGCSGSAGTWTGSAPAPTPATGTPPGSWPCCSGSAGTWTGPCTSCAPAPTPATGTPPSS